MSEAAATALPLPSQNIPENPKRKTARAGVETLSHVSGIIGLADAGTHLGKVATVVEKGINKGATKSCKGSYQVGVAQTSGIVSEGRRCGTARSYDFGWSRGGGRGSDHLLRDAGSLSRSVISNRW